MNPNAYKYLYPCQKNGNIYNQLSQKMPKTQTRPSKSLHAQQNKLSSSRASDPSVPNKKRHTIAKSRQHRVCKNEEIDEQLVDTFMDLIKIVNQQFLNNSPFPPKHERKNTKPLCHFSQKTAFEVTILPTIKECPIVAEQEEYHIKKEKEQTEISSSGEKFQ